MQAEIAINHGDVVFPWGVRSDVSIAVSAGTTVGIAADPYEADQIIDATGQLVFPGFIDTHTHIGFSGSNAELATETAGAAAGGITTCLIYYRQLARYGEDLRSFIAQGERLSSVDFGVHLGILTDDHLEQVEELSSELGITSFKMYTCYKDGELAQFGVRGEDDGFILDALTLLATIPGAVVNVHSENDDIYGRRLRALKAGRVSGSVLRQWSWARPPFGEAEAIARVAFLARLAGATVFIPHVGSSAALDACREAQAAGTKLHLETCPHYLLLDADGEGQVQYAKVNPPVREAGDRLAIQQALKSGGIDTVGTDHAAVPLAGKQGKSAWEARPGFPGVDTMVPALLHLVSSGILTPESLASATERSAKLFGLTSKGRIEVGLDADFTICDLGASREVAAAAFPSCSDLSVYEGMRLTGWPSWTILRGAVVARNGEITRPQSGRYLKRGRADNAKPAE